jgi:hypothetical protein
MAQAERRPLLDIGARAYCSTTARETRSKRLTRLAPEELEWE